jgi:hypothetical protein
VRGGGRRSSGSRQLDLMDSPLAQHELGVVFGKRRFRKSGKRCGRPLRRSTGKVRHRTGPECPNPLRGLWDTFLSANGRCPVRRPLPIYEDSRLRSKPDRCGNLTSNSVALVQPHGVHEPSFEPPPDTALPARASRLNETGPE